MSRNAPVDPQSDAFIDFIGRTRQAHPDFGPPPYGIPYVGVGGGQPRVPVAFVSYPSESDAGFGGEAGYRVFLPPRATFSAAVFANRYDNLRSQEPTPSLGVPVVLANRHNARTSGVEITGRVDATPRIAISGGYALLRQRFSFDAGSADLTAGAFEHNDPSHQFWIRGSSDPGARLEIDATFRRVGALPNPRVPSYGELMVRVARPLTDRLSVELIGDNLLHDRHAEWFNVGPRMAAPRAVFARLTWQSR